MFDTSTMTSVSSSSTGPIVPTFTEVKVDQPTVETLTSRRVYEIFTMIRKEKDWKITIKAIDFVIRCQVNSQLTTVEVGSLLILADQISQCCVKRHINPRHVQLAYHKLMKERNR